MSTTDVGEGGRVAGRWTFLTNHAHVLVHLSRDPEARLSDIAVAVGVRERAVQRLIGDLVEAGYLERERVGRRNRYVLHLDIGLRHPLEGDHSVGELIGIFSGDDLDAA